MPHLTCLSSQTVSSRQKVCRPDRSDILQATCQQPIRQEEEKLGVGMLEFQQEENDEIEMLPAHRSVSLFPLRGSNTTSALKPLVSNSPQESTIKISTDILNASYQLGYRLNMHPRIGLSFNHMRY